MSGKVSVDHRLDQLFERNPRVPAKFVAGFGRVTDQPN